VVARFNLSDWIEEYKSEDGLTYIIPSYKIERLKEIEEENQDLKDALKGSLEKSYTKEQVFNRKIEAKSSCICKGFYQPAHCPVHGPK